MHQNCSWNYIWECRSMPNSFFFWIETLTESDLKELTEEGLPFLILFHKPEDMSSVVTFEREVIKQLVHERSKSFKFICKHYF